MRIPDALITRKYFLQEMSQDPVFSARFPVPYAEITRVLDNAKTDPQTAKYLNSPDPDFHAFAINQP